MLGVVVQMAFFLVFPTAVVAIFSPLPIIPMVRAGFVVGGFVDVKEAHEVARFIVDGDGGASHFIVVENPLGTGTKVVQAIGIGHVFERGRMAFL